MTSLKKATQMEEKSLRPMVHEIYAKGSLELSSRSMDHDIINNEEADGRKSGKVFVPQLPTLSSDETPPRDHVQTGDGSINVDIRDTRSAPAPGSSGTMSGDPRELVVNLCRQFYHLGWVIGTGGAISIKHGNRVFMTPSGLQKERLRVSDLFVLDQKGAVLHYPWSHTGGKRCVGFILHVWVLYSTGEGLQIIELLV